MDNTYLSNSKILGTTIIILTHEIRIHTLISSNQNTELSVYKCKFESCISTFFVSISITGIEVVIKRFIAANVDAQTVLGFNIKSYVV